MPTSHHVASFDGVYQEESSTFWTGANPGRYPSILRVARDSPGAPAFNFSQNLAIGPERRTTTDTNDDVLYHSLFSLSNPERFLPLVPNGR
jgi:hypothetical protein